MVGPTVLGRGKGTVPVVNHDERMQRILARLDHHRTARPASLGAALCTTSVEVLELSGAGITLRSGHGSHNSIGASSPDMATLHDLERTLGEGPCVDAFALGEPVLEPDLARPVRPRWLAFTAGALDTEARAAFGFPLQIGAARLGALNLYAARPGALTDDQHLDALVMAEVVVQAVLTDVASQTTGTAIDAGLLEQVGDELEIHQAAGMISVQLSVGIPDALARLRAHAFVEGASVHAVAADVVGRRLRFEP